MLKHYRIITNTTEFSHYAENKKQAKELAAEVMRKFGYAFGAYIVKIKVCNYDN